MIESGAQLTDPTDRLSVTAAPSGEPILCGLSGGVDSSVACYLLQEQGFRPIGRTLLLRDGGERDARDAAAICASLAVPFDVIDWRQPFRQQITDDFFATYAAGQTPNPCVLCNAQIKFAALLAEADRLGCRRIATGHYASITAGPEPGRLTLRRTDTGWKDQTYFLYRLSQDQLTRILFPLANLNKTRVREIARQADLRGAGEAADGKGMGADGTPAGPSLLADRPDSQDVCFAADGYIPFLRQEAQRRGGDWMDRLFTPGPVVNLDGQPIGTHRGLVWYTIGQRKGFSVQTTDRLFVLGLQPDTNQLVVGPYDQALRSEIDIRAVVYSGRSAFSAGAPVLARVRSSAHPAAAEVWPLPASDRLRIRFAQPVFAPAPGQSCVLYEGETVVAGGIIL